LAVTHSNGAADVLLEALLELGVPAVRAGRPASVSPQVQHRSVIALAEKLPHIKEMRQELLRQSARASFFSSRNNSGDFGAGLQWQLKKSLEDAQSMLLQSAPVVVTSCIGAHQLVELQASNIDCSLFPLVVLDEAAQCTEPALLTALLAAQAQQVVLVGDTQQLPPTVTSSSKTLRESLGVSPMARMEAAGVHQKTLQVQYRMPQALLEHPSRYFYDGMVQSADNIQTDANSPVSLPAGFPWPNASLPLAFVQSGTGDMEMVHTFGGRSNPCEAKQIAVIVSRLLHEGDVFAKDIAILTPYARQVQAIRSALEEQALRLRQGNVTLEAASFPTQQRLRGNSVRDVKVGTIDSFQGQETDIVIFSAVRSNSLSELGFLRDPRRLNVAITRARRGLILLGDSTTLSSCRHWQALIQSCHDRGCFVVEYRMDTVKEASAVFPTGNGTVANATDVLEEIGVLDSTLDFSNTSDSFYGLFSVRDSCDISSLL
jgi:regulator of nonsense transcripts 1